MKYACIFELGPLHFFRVPESAAPMHTSGLLLPQDHPPWPDWGYTLSEFIRTLNAWKADKAPGQRHLYTHAGFVLLQLALERRYAMPIDELIDQPVLQPLGMTSTMLPRGDDGPRGRLSPEYKSRAVQGYSRQQRADRRSPAIRPAITIGRGPVRCTLPRAT